MRVRFSVELRCLLNNMFYKQYLRRTIQRIVPDYLHTVSLHRPRDICIVVRVYFPHPIRYLCGGELEVECRLRSPRVDFKLVLHCSNQ